MHLEMGLMRTLPDGLRVFAADHQGVLVDEFVVAVGDAGNAGDETHLLRLCRKGAFVLRRGAEGIGLAGAEFDAQVVGKCADTTGPRPLLNILVAGGERPTILRVGVLTEGHAFGAEREKGELHEGVRLDAVCKVATAALRVPARAALRSAGWGKDQRALVAIVVAAGFRRLYVAAELSILRGRIVPAEIRPIDGAAVLPDAGEPLVNVLTRDASGFASLGGTARPGRRDHGATPTQLRGDDYRENDRGEQSRRANEHRPRS